MGLVDAIAGTIGSVAGAIGQSKAANTDAICGPKPGIFKYKGDVKDEYNACLKKSQEAQINAANAQAESLRNAQTRKKWIVPVVVIAVLVVIVTAIILIRKARKK